jgi:hypothetical protein
LITCGSSACSVGKRVANGLACTRVAHCTFTVGTTDMPGPT